MEVKISQKEAKATLKCTKCGETYETRSNYLTEPIDVFGEWLDAIAEANDNNKAAAEAERQEDEE